MNERYGLWSTPDEVIARNLKRLRKERELSRRRLADLVAEITGDEWSQWKIIDLEGARSSRAQPRPATWSDLVDLAVVLKVTVFDLVLPDVDTEVVVASASKTEHTTFPDDAPETVRGKPRSRRIEYLHAAGLDEFGTLLFGLPGTSITRENLDKIAAKWELDIDDALIDIAQVQQGLEAAIAKIERLTAERKDTE